MSKKIKTMKWQNVTLEGFPVNMSDKFEGFVGLEECTDYGMEKENKITKKQKEPKKRKMEPNKTEKENCIPNKKFKLSNGFIVEPCEAVTPSLTNEVQVSKIKTKKKNKSKSEITTDKKTHQNVSKLKIKLGDNIKEDSCELTPEDMLSWAEFKLPEEIVKALMELGFKQPTKIQQMSLPAAIHGRRDILGAAETGSGKTLAFGLPILSGIMKLKEKAKLKNLDVYDIPFKKNSVKRKQFIGVSKKQDTNRKNKKCKKIGSKEPSESYSSGKENDVKNSVDDECESDEESVDTSKNNQSKKDFLKDIEIPLKKKEESADEDTNSDEYVHFSEMFDSDDLASSNDETQNDQNDDESKVRAMKPDDQDGFDEVDKDETGIGCVKVLEDSDIPEQPIVKTGKPLYALILTPTRELAIQISRHLIAVAKYTGIRIATIVGGMAAVKQERVLRSGPEVVVATPGRLWELVNQGEPHLQQLPSVKFLAIDETDRMIERGHFEELEPLLEKLNLEENYRDSRQNFVFSATLTMVHDLPSHMKGKKVTKRGKIINRKIAKMTSEQKIKRLIAMVGMTDPKVVDITSQNLGTAETLTECRITCSLDQKDAYLYYILKRYPGRTIVFCNSINSVKRLVQILLLLKRRTFPLHASLPQRQRLKNLERFRDDRHGVLVATDVAARGLDIPDVEHVIHYQVPKTAENYVHRSGRTARANKEGLTILMMEPSEGYTYSKICRTLNKTTELANFPIPTTSVTVLKEMINLAREIEVLELRTRRSTQALGWREKAAKEMDIIIDDDDLPVKEVDPRIDRELRNKKRQLDSMLSQPIFPKGFSYKYPTLNEICPLQPPAEEKALALMKKALETGELKKEKRKGKNQSLLQLEKSFKK